MYGKHFASTYTGSMVGAGLNVFAVWGYVIANAVNGRVELNPKLLAMVLGGSEDEIDAAITYLTNPDPGSRTKDNEGRRLIREGHFQYLVPTHAAYRAILNEEERREYNRRKQAEHRAKEAVKDNVNDCQSQSSMSAHTEAEANTHAEAETKAKEPAPARPSRAVLSESDALVSLAQYWQMTKGCAVTKLQRENLDAALKAGTTMGQAKGVIDAVRTDIAPWDLKTRLLDAAGVKGETGKGLKDGRSTASGQGTPGGLGGFVQHEAGKFGGR